MATKMAAKMETFHWKATKMAPTLSKLVKNHIFTDFSVEGWGGQWEDMDAAGK